MPEARLVLGGVGDEAAPDLDGQLAALRRLGWPAIELRTVEGGQIAELSRERFEALAGRLEAAGVRTVAIASRIGGWGRSTSTPLELDLRELELLAPRARRLGTRYVRVMSFENDGLAPEAWRDEALSRLAELAARARELGLVLLHENCAGWAGQGPQQTLELLRAVDSPALRLLFDVGNGLAYGYDAAEFLAPVLPWVEHVHVKDAVRTPDGVRYVEPGAGESGVVACVRALLAAGYAGAWVIEPHVHLAPHRGVTIAPAEAIDDFVRCGRALERLLEREAAPAAVGS